MKRSEMNTKIAIQRFWFGELKIEDVLKGYGLSKGGSPNREKVVKILVKTKRDFVNGWSFFTREGIDLKIRKILG